MKVHYGEGVAIHTGPEPCVGPREGSGEASAGERAGWPLSRERAIVPGADVVTVTEGHTSGASARASAGPAWSETPACTDAPCPGTGRSPARPGVRPGSASGR